MSAIMINFSWEGMELTFLIVVQKNVFHISELDCSTHKIYCYFRIVQQHNFLNLLQLKRLQFSRTLQFVNGGILLIWCSSLYIIVLENTIARGELSLQSKETQADAPGGSRQCREDEVIIYRQLEGDLASSQKEKLIILSFLKIHRRKCVHSY